MLATNGLDFVQITTICVLLPTTLVICHKQIKPEERSLNNYVATSVPYTVESSHLQHDDMTLISSSSPEKTDPNYVQHDRTSQEMLDCVNENRCVNNVTINDQIAEGTFKPYSQDELNKILQKFEGEKEHLEAQDTTNNKVATFYNLAGGNNIETSSPTNDPDKSKAWNLISYHQYQQPVNHNSNTNNNNNNNNNKNPYDDRMGWVTLEPIAWSSSQVQKWEPNSKPGWPLPPSNNGPWGSPGQYQQQSNYGGYSDRPYKKPTYQYQSKPWNSKPQQFSEHFGNQEIITDGQPGYFPPDRPSSSLPQQSQGSYKPWLEHTQSISYIDSGNRPATHVVYQGIGTGIPPHHSMADKQPASSSSGGDGHWVLLSSTKGYSVPQRQRSSARSLDFTENFPAEKTDTEKKPERPLLARRSIRLTVLPPGDGKTVTSHNGMIEVESSGKTVDESHREHLARMIKFGNASQNEVRTIRSNSFHNIPANVEAVARPIDRRSTLLGAAGAGIIPATMAMILPMLLGRKKRSIEPEILTLNIRNYAPPEIPTRYDKKNTHFRRFMY